VVQRKILDYLGKVPNLYFVKIILANRRGVPDIHVCYRGKYIAFEAKRVGKEAEALQEYEMTKIRKAGGFATVVYSLDEVKQFIDSISNQ